MTTRITHLGNDGVLLDDGTNRVIIDGLYRGILERWSHLPDDLQLKLEQAEEPFNDIDLALVTHSHLDHYHPESVGLHMQHNATMQLIAPQQVLADMEEKFAGYGEVQDRTNDYALKWYQSTQETVNGVDVTVLGMHHFNMFEYDFSGVQNYGYVVHMNGKNYLHLGDVEMSKDNLEKFDFHHMDIDVVFLPMFSKNLLPARRDLINAIVEPKHVVALHVMLGTEEETPEQVQA